MMGFLFLLGQQCIVEILQKRHVFRNWILEVLLVDLMNATVDDRLFYRLQAFFAAHDKLTQRQDEIRLQGNGVVLLGVVQVDVHRIHVLGAGRTDVDDLPVKTLHESCIFRLRITDDHIVIRHQEGVCDFPLCRERLTRTGSTED